VLRPDAAAKSLGTLRELTGAEAVAGALSGGARAGHLAIIDGVTGLVWAPGGTVRGIATFTVREGRVVAIDATGDAARIAELDVVLV
jgi:hypothetical protein